ncbi:growth hormone secretagogue receptor type 1-like [Styela clava]
MANDSNFSEFDQFNVTQIDQNFGNDGNNVTSSPTGPLPQEPFFTQLEVAGLGSIICLMSIIGIILNSITFFAILLDTKLKNSVFNVFISSLCVSDFFSSISNPLTFLALMGTHKDYLFPDIVCKLHTAVDIWTTICTIQHILVFSLLRLIAVSYPHHIKRISVLMAKIGVAFIWLETFGVSFVPYFYFMGVFKGSHLDPNVMLCRGGGQTIIAFSQYVKYSYPIIFYAPMMLVVICSIALIYLMIRRKLSKEALGNGRETKDENFAILQLSLILLSFLIGYIPDVARRLFNTNNSLRTKSDLLIYIIPIFILRFSECLNPVFYNISSSSIRNASVDLLKKLFCCWKRDSRPLQESERDRRRLPGSQETKFSEQNTRKTNA